jgi:hypothetical protein
VGATGLAVGGACCCAAVEDMLLLIGAAVAVGVAAFATCSAEVEAVPGREAALTDNEAAAGTDAACAMGLVDEDSASFCRCLSYAASVTRRRGMVTVRTRSRFFQT